MLLSPNSLSLGAPTLPQAVAVGVAQLTNSSVTLVGSVNTEGQNQTYYGSGSASASVFPPVSWFVYGTSSAMTSRTSAQVASATTSASAFMTTAAPLINLSPGTEYWFAVACQTAAGSAVSSSLTFVTGAPPPPALTGESFIPPGAEVPHFRWPFTIRNNGALVDEQDSESEIVSCVNTTLDCFVGQWPENPAFGIPDYTFVQAPFDVSSMAQALARWEPRAGINILSTMNLDGTTGSWTVSVTSEG